jgi:alpha-ketoglutarate-dependent 2,4-dichlorophenoxyacetate dioxygenase
MKESSMAISIYPITPNFAAEVGDIDLSQPISAENEKAIKDAFWKYAVLIFPEQSLTHEQHVAFSKLFGPLEEPIKPGKNDAGKARIPANISDVSNLDHNNQPWSADSRQRMFQLGNRLWHTDSSFRHLPGRASMLYARTIAPIGGHTEFADMRAAWDNLPNDIRERIGGLIVEHSIFTSRAKCGFTSFPDDERALLPPVLQVLVRTIPETGIRALYLASHAARVIDMPEKESDALLKNLMEHATQRQFVYTHRWRLNDLVMWDNRCTMHRGTDFDDIRWKRDIQRTTVSDLANSCELAASAPLTVS